MPVPQATGKKQKKRKSNAHLLAMGSQHTIQVQYSIHYTLYSYATPLHVQYSIHYALYSYATPTY
jgi:hypothetical protein